jgi:F-type H+-transporting ATPase subunit b
MSQELWRLIGETIVQCITFGLFFWIMKLFAWPAIMNLIEGRRREIEDGFAEIDRKQAEAERLHKEYQAHLRDIEQEARAKIQEAVVEGRRVAAEIGENARADARKIAERAQRNVQIELAKARIELREEIITMTLTASERLLREQLDPAAHRRQVDHFLADLESKQ